MTNNDQHLENLIDDLLEGNLPVDAADRARRQLDRESGLLDREIRTHLKNRGLTMSGTERLAASLRSRLRAIPGREASRYPAVLRWGLAATAAVLMAAVPVIYRQHAHDVPSPAEIAEARAELAIAFSYVQQIGNRTDYYLKREISHNLQDAIIDGIFLGLANKPKQG
jgi:hypothetical protein